MKINKKLQTDFFYLCIHYLITTTCNSTHDTSYEFRRRFQIDSLIVRIFEFPM